MQTLTEQRPLPLVLGIAMDQDPGEAGLRSVVAANLAALMRESRALKTIEAVETRTAQTGAKVGKSTVARLLRAETPITLDKLAALAAAFGVEPWQILSPDGATAGPAPSAWSKHARELAKLCDEELAPEDRAGPVGRQSTRDHPKASPTHDSEYKRDHPACADHHGLCPDSPGLMVRPAPQLLTDLHRATH